MATEYLEHKLSLLPPRPGCYLMKDINSKIIYVGKAKNLKNRVRSYFKSSHEGKTARLVSEIRDFETIITSNDKEAFLLEITLIQKHQPYYNIKLKRGTGYPYIKITNERDPKMEITGLVKKPVYSIKLDEITPDFFMNSCVLLKDYSPQYNQTIISRQVINEPILDTMAECIPFMRTSLIAGTGIKGMRVDDADQERSVNEASYSIVDAALNGDMYVPVVVPVELQELTDGAVAKSEEYMLAMQSLDNFRLSTYGLENGGLFQKKAHILEAEAAVNGGNVGLVMQDSLTRRQNFCDIINSIWGLGIWVEPSESVLGMDQNMDGAAYDVNNAPVEGGNNVGDTSGSDDTTI